MMIIMTLTLTLGVAQSHDFSIQISQLVDLRHRDRISLCKDVLMKANGSMHKFVLKTSIITSTNRYARACFVNILAITDGATCSTVSETIHFKHENMNNRIMQSLPHLPFRYVDLMHASGRKVHCFRIEQFCTSLKKVSCARSPWHYSLWQQ